MYNLVSNMIGSAASAEIVTAACSAISLLLVVVFVDIIKDIFSAFWRG